jgi:hypothetical protein
MTNACVESPYKISLIQIPQTVEWDEYFITLFADILPAHCGSDVWFVVAGMYTLLGETNHAFANLLRSEIRVTDREGKTWSTFLICSLLASDLKPNRTTCAIVMLISFVDAVAKE